MELALMLRSHTARDILAVADEFTSPPKAIWEYVANSLQYTQSGRDPVVDVEINQRKQLIRISDNGRGMDESAIRSFLTMHAPNEDRLAGKAGRGYFGTGKAAAFGIGLVLTVRTVRDGRRFCFEIRRDDVEALRNKPDATEVPLHVVEAGTTNTEANGTIVDIRGFRQGVSVDAAKVRTYLSKRLKRYPRAQVRVNGRPCIPETIATDPRYDRVVEVPPDLVPWIGRTQLELHVALSSLDEENRGVFAWVAGQRLSLGLCGYEGHKDAPKIFGDVDAPELDPDLHPEWPSAFSQGRREEPNRDHPAVPRLLSWVGSEIRNLTAELDEEERRRRDEEELRRLRSIGSEIERLLNTAYQQEELRLGPAHAPGAGAPRIGHIDPAGSDERFTEGGDIPAEEVAPAGGLGGTGGDGEAHSIPDAQPELEPSPTGQRDARPFGVAPTASRPRGGFRVEFRHDGEDMERGRYVPDGHLIMVNLDHPEVRAAKLIGGDVERWLYREIALVEFAFALQQEQVRREGGLGAPAAATSLAAARDRIHRVARLGAGVMDRGAGVTT